MTRNSLFSIPFVCFALMILPALAWGQRFDLEAYLKKIDANGNGSLESSEMNGRTRDFIAKMGFNVEKSVSIKKIVSKAKKDRERREKEEKRGSQPAKELAVPGFAPESNDDDKREGVPGFAPESEGAQGSSSKTAAPKVSESIQRQVDDVLRRYDRNRNGILEADEIKNARWGSPSPYSNDKNKDGKLSKSELVQRYLDRERYSNRQRNSRGDRDRSDDRRRSSSSRSSSSSSQYDFKSSSTSTGSSRSSSSRSRSSSSSSSSSSRKVDTKKYEAYVNGLMDRYDKNKNGKFEKEELAEMRRPPKTADANGDGEITKKELLDSLTGANKTSSSTSAKPDSKTSSRSTSSSSRSSRFSRSSSRSSRSSGGLGSKDLNGDGQIQMSEFTKAWTDKLAEEFIKKDKNGDGVLSASEWNG